ncbi:putative odorant receptor 85e [Toxorhynchites rutilus septentrionalis]|uniref:putative odorant receptor 85e n=1 Tax=Toxorhynchites rutilus septentrionalis TaxID=329112 RepID=UPI00247850D0|nr:putative odorant receptor 85e [Toxorhynchites rutilus septentrionalis]
MVLLALWPYDFNQHLPTTLQGRFRISLLLNVMCYTFWQFICLHITIFNIKTIVDNIDNLGDIFTQMANAIIYGSMFIVNVYFRWNYQREAQLFELMADKFKRRSATGISYVEYESSKRFVNKFFKFWITTCTAVTFHWVVIPVIQWERVLPFEFWYPFDVSHSPMYEIAYAGQIVGQLQVGITYGMTASLLMAYIFIVCGQFGILCCSLRNSYNTAMINGGNYHHQLTMLQNLYKTYLQSAKSSWFEKELLEEFSIAPRTLAKRLKPPPINHRYLMQLSNELATALDDCIDHHVVLINFCRRLGEYYHPFLMLTFFQEVSLLCLLAYIATMDDLSPMQVANIVEYLLVAVSELVWMSYLGQILKTQNINVIDALMDSPWYECGAAFRQRALMILANSLKPLKLTAFKMYDLDMKTCLSVLRISLSYFTLLQKIGHKKSNIYI